MTARDNIAAEIAAASAQGTGLSEFWSTVFQEPDAIQAITAANGWHGAQLHQRFEEARDAVNYRTAPVYRRRRWKFITLRDQDRDKAPVTAVRVGATAVVGGADVPRVGGHVPVPGFSSYPLPAGVRSVGALVDHLQTSVNILVPGADYILANNSIMFRKGSDPFDRGFPVRTAADGVRTVALWARDVQEESTLLPRFSGYILGVAGEPSNWLRDYTNALGAVASYGPSPERLAEYVYTALDVPFTRRAETVQHVGALGADAFGVITDAATYAVRAGDQAAACSVGDVLPPYTPITTAVRISETLDTGVTSISLPTYASRGAVGGLSAPVRQSTIRYIGADVNGNPRLRFDLCGAGADIDSFWSRVDAYYERSGTSPEVLLGDYLVDSRPNTPGAVWGSLSPARFFVDYYYGNSAKFITVDRGRLSEFGLQGLDRLREALKYLPATTRLVIQTDVGVADEVEELVESGQPAGFALCGVADAVPRPADCVTAYLVPTCKGGRI